MLGTVDQSGNVTSARKYDVYGAVRQLTGGSGTRHQFVGNLGHPSDDETGLIYMRVRYYDPVTGRFVSEDTAKDGANWFVYARSAPTRFSDPTGEVSSEFYFHVSLWLRILMFQVIGRAFDDALEMIRKTKNYLEADVTDGRLAGLLGSLNKALSSAEIAMSGKSLRNNVAEALTCAVLMRWAEAMGWIKAVDEGWGS